MIDETILERLIRMEEKLDHYLHRSRNSETKIEALDVRIRAIETGTARIMGSVAVVALIVSTLGSSVVERLAS
jgi:uncharacterized membrane protein